MKKEVLQFYSMQYLVRYPTGYEKGKKYPVIFFLHGSGSRGNDIHALMNNPFFTITDESTDFPFVTVAPQCSENTWFDMFETLESFVHKLVKEDYVDASRLYLMGVSMGGYGAWQLAMSMPEYFAAVVPISGGGMYWNAGRLLNVPVWAFHGEIDTVVFIDESTKMVERVNQCGGNARLTIFPGKGHTLWDDVYRNQEVFEWLLSNQNSNIAELIDTYQGSELYG